VEAKAFKEVECKKCKTKETVWLTFGGPFGKDKDGDWYKGFLYGYCCKCKENRVILKPGDTGKVQFKHCDQTQIADLKDFTAYYGYCELCDYHGNIKTKVTCQVCGKELIVTLAEN
jgi:ribosomal protein S27E